MNQVNNPSEVSEKRDKKITIAFILAAFGFLLFIALALTLPQPPSS